VNIIKVKKVISFNFRMYHSRLKNRPVRNAIIILSVCKRCLLLKSPIQPTVCSPQVIASCEATTNNFDLSKFQHFFLILYLFLYEQFQCSTSSAFLSFDLLKHTYGFNRHFPGGSITCVGRLSLWFTFFPFVPYIFASSRDNQNFFDSLLDTISSIFLGHPLSSSI